LELKSPAAVPLILFTLVFYSGYKMTIEWLQCDAERRKHFAARIDYWVAHAIGVVAVGISTVQYLWRVRIVDILSNSFNGFAIAIFLAVIFLYLTIRVYIHEWRTYKYSRAQRSRAIVGVLVLLFLTVVAGVQPFQEKNGIFSFEFGLGSGIVVLLFFEIIAFMLKRRRA
jgi:tellurite resistance protein TehA-like permease